MFRKKRIFYGVCFVVEQKFFFFLYSEASVELSKCEFMVFPDSAPPIPQIAVMAGPMTFRFNDGAEEKKKNNWDFLLTPFFLVLEREEGEESQVRVQRW